MRNSVLNEKMREVDLGVVTCIDSIVRHCEILLDEKTSQAEQEWAKAQVRLNAGIYRNTLDELLIALEEPNFAKNPQNPTACYRIAVRKILTMSICTKYPWRLTPNAPDVI